MKKFNKNLLFMFLALEMFMPINTFNFEDEQYYLNDMCVTKSDSFSGSGICRLIEDCPVILAQIINRNYNYTICGYEGFSQVVCCPMERSAKMITLNNNLKLSESVECIIESTKEIGIIKFRSDCEGFKENSNQSKPFCNFDICKDLICCPKLSTRFKQVCSHVDMPADLITLRLHLHQECQVKDTNLKERYQKSCDYATRNPHMQEKLQSVCNDDSCNGWYCCPIEEPHDKYHCDNKMPLPNVKMVGPKCFNSKTGEMGRCRSMQDCGGGDRFQSNQLDKCGKHCCIDYYCCPDPFQDISNQPLAVQKCSEYSKFVNKHELEVAMDFYGNRTTCTPEMLPVGGVVVEPGEYPHMAALGYELNGEYTWNCGGSLISDEYVLTAAHCLVNRPSIGELKKVRFGVIDLYNDIELLDCPEDYQVLQRIPHHWYNRRFIYYDIGLIQLDRKVKFNFHIRPICLPSTSVVPNNTESMGWGDTGTFEEKHGKLIKVQQDLYSHEQCQEYYKNYNSIRHNIGVVKEIQVCAGSKYDIQGTCSGDSGGPLLAKHPKMNGVFEIYGIVSAGPICGQVNTPGIYTLVYPFKDWIESIVFSDIS